MLLLDADNALDYLHAEGRLPLEVAAFVVPLAWGVSNIVLRITPASGPELVLKQARERLRTRVDWFSRLERIWTEAALMRRLKPLLPEGVVPAVLFEDRPNYLFGMEAVTADHSVWKAELLAGRVDALMTPRLAEILARIHRGTWGDDAFRREFSDRAVFDELRIDPFYRHTLRTHPDLTSPINALIEETYAITACLVHGDFSPKNILIHGDRLTLVDYETGHYGDPAFDVGFFLSHLALKGVRFRGRHAPYVQLIRDFIRHYSTAAEVRPQATEFDAAGVLRRTVGHLAGCMLARIDGKSPVDYLPDDRQRNLVRGYCRGLFLDSTVGLEAAVDCLADALAAR